LAFGILAFWQRNACCSQTVNPKWSTVGKKSGSQDKADQVEPQHFYLSAAQLASRDALMAQCVHIRVRDEDLSWETAQDGDPTGPHNAHQASSTPVTAGGVFRRTYDELGSCVLSFRQLFKEGKLFQPKSRQGACLARSARTVQVLFTIRTLLSLSLSPFKLSSAARRQLPHLSGASAPDPIFPLHLPEFNKTLKSKPTFNSQQPIVPSTHCSCPRLAG
jgi:hypothetical protein